MCLSECRWTRLCTEWHIGDAELSLPALRSFVGVRGKGGDVDQPGDAVIRAKELIPETQERIRTDADGVPYLLLRQELPRGYAPDRYSPECDRKSGGASATWARIPCPARSSSGNIGSFDESRVNLLIHRMSYDESKDRSDRSDGKRGRAIR